MPIYLLTCALQSTDHDYAPLWQSLVAAGATRGFETTWFIDVLQNLDEVNRSVLAHLAPGDRVMVVELAPDTRWAGTNLLQDARPWLEARRSKK